MIGEDEGSKTFLNTNHMIASALCAIIILLLLSAGAASATIITVDDSGGADYTSIQAAVDNASAGDTIKVRSGTYYEYVNINKQLTLQGVDTGDGMPVVDAGLVTDPGSEGHHTNLPGLGGFDRAATGCR